MVDPRDLTYLGGEESKQPRSMALFASLAIVGCLVGVLALVLALNAPREEQQAKARPQPGSRGQEPAQRRSVELPKIPAEVDPPNPEQGLQREALPEILPSSREALPEVVPPARPDPKAKLGTPIRREPIEPLPQLPSKTDHVLVDPPGKLLKEIVPGYETREIDGFKMLLSTLAIKEGRRDGGKAFNALVTEFDGLVEVLPPKVLVPLRRVLVWIEWDNVDRSNPRVLAKYYGGSIWTLDGHDHHLKSYAIEVLSLKNLAFQKSLSADRSHLVLLHEMAHAVHHVFVPNGFDNPGVIFAYNQAMDRRLYDRVQTAGGGIDRAYAATNQVEYFAELTCAYLDRCNYFPFDRKDLKEHDPTGYQLMEGLWKEAADRTVPRVKKETDRGAQEGAQEKLDDQRRGLVKDYAEANLPAWPRIRDKEWEGPFPAVDPQGKQGVVFRVKGTLKIYSMATEKTVNTTQFLYFFIIGNRVEMQVTKGSWDTCKFKRQG
jgi:hypothetical protein